jgi:hypothetical protein
MIPKNPAPPKKQIEIGKFTRAFSTDINVFEIYIKKEKNIIFQFLV